MVEAAKAVIWPYPAMAASRRPSAFGHSPAPPLISKKEN
jgi:hypothetical protein